MNLKQLWIFSSIILSLWQGSALAAWHLTDAFPNLQFSDPSQFRETPRGGSIFLLERSGRVWTFDHDASVNQKTLVLDFSARTHLGSRDDGALSLALHPNFGDPDSSSRGYFYVFYVTSVDDSNYIRLSRFTIPDGSNVADPSSELILVNQKKLGGGHDGGGLQFGPDGYLYVSIGDSACCGDPFRITQNISENFFGTMLRLDVDQRGQPWSHAVRKTPTLGQTAGYFIPNDNPFSGQDGALEEIWALGFRNPYRFSFDRLTNQIWEGDVGEGTYEEINLVSRGSNHQWSYMEGLGQRTERPAVIIGIEAPPVYQYQHSVDGICVIGGVVYRGQNLRQLFGNYVFGDAMSGKVWSLALGPGGPIRIELMQFPIGVDDYLSSFDQDNAGEIFVLKLNLSGSDGKIFRLVNND